MAFSKIIAESMDLSDAYNFTGTLQQNGASIGGNNKPLLFVRRSSNQTISDNTLTKIQFDTEVFDTNTAYDNSSNYRYTVPSGQDGKHFVYSQFYGFGNNNDEKAFEINIYKNGSIVARNYIHHEGQGTGSSGSTTMSVAGIIDLAASDYIEIYGKIDVNSGTPAIQGGSLTNNYTFLTISKMIE